MNIKVVALNQCKKGAVMAKGHMTKDVSRYENGKRIFKISMNLIPAYYENAYFIHAKNDEEFKSTIKFHIVDHSTKDVKEVYANVSPSKLEDLFFMCNRVREGYNKPFVLLNEEKVIGAAINKEGYAPVRKFKITFGDNDHSGIPYRLKWFSTIENGKAKIKPTDGGLCSYISETYICENKQFLRIGELDFYHLISDAFKSMRIWENVVGAHLIKQHIIETKKYYDEKNEEKRNV